MIENLKQASPPGTRYYHAARVAERVAARDAERVAEWVAEWVAERVRRASEEEFEQKSCEKTTPLILGTCDISRI